MKVYGVAPDVVSYTMAMDACAKAASWEMVCSISLVDGAFFISSRCFFVTLRRNVSDLELLERPSLSCCKPQARVICSCFF